MGSYGLCVSRETNSLLRKIENNKSGSPSNSLSDEFIYKFCGIFYAHLQHLKYKINVKSFT